MLYVYSNGRGAKSRRDERMRGRRWRRKRREIPPTGRKRGTKDKSSCCVYREAGRRTTAASTCRTGCYLPPCYSCARAKLINSKVEALNAPRISARVYLPSRFDSRCCSESNGGKVSVCLYPRTVKRNIVTHMGRDISLPSIFCTCHFCVLIV